MMKHRKPGRKNRARIRLEPASPPIPAKFPRQERERGDFSRRLPGVEQCFHPDGRRSDRTSHRVGAARFHRGQTRHNRFPVGFVGPGSGTRSEDSPGIWLGIAGKKGTNEPSGQRRGENVRITHMSMNDQLPCGGYVNCFVGKPRRIIRQARVAYGESHATPSSN